MQFPRCNSCSSVDWDLIDTRRDSGYTIDIYRCHTCLRDMSWSYATPDQALPRPQGPPGMA